MSGESPSASRIAAKAEIRNAILSAAATILAAEGRDALSARRLARAINASTKVIYSHFGGMDGVVSGIYSDAFERLTGTLKEAARRPGTAPMRLKRVAGAYRRFAQENPAVFELMYGGRARELVPSRENRAPAAASLDVIADVLKDGQKAGEIRNGPARAMAYEFWAAMHGAVALEVTDWLDRNGRAVFKAVTAAAIAALVD